jgi:hypothetical protein
VIAQLRDVLAAENSAIMTQKHNYSRLLNPQGAKLDLLSIRVRQGNVSQFVAERWHRKRFSREDNGKTVAPFSGNPDYLANAGTWQS